MNLTDEDKKLLTEWLGKCWHEWRDVYDATDNITQPTCTKCHGTWGREPLPRLDFTDWRVVGRLIEKMKHINVAFPDTTQKWCAAFFHHKNGREEFYFGDSPQSAIVLACLAYLKEEKR